MATPSEIYAELCKTIPLAPLSEIKKLTASQWDKAIRDIPGICSLRNAIEWEKRDAKERIRRYHLQKKL